jgi:hypothetical protein
MPSAKNVEIEDTAYIFKAAERKQQDRDEWVLMLCVSSRSSQLHSTLIPYISLRGPERNGVDLGMYNLSMAMNG